MPNQELVDFVLKQKFYSGKWALQQDQKNLEKENILWNRIIDRKYAHSQTNKAN